MVRTRIVWVVFALVFLARAMVPVGFMPDFSGQHLVQICSGTEIKTVMLDENGMPVSSDHQKAPCSFSFLSAFFDGPEEFYQIFETPDFLETADVPFLQSFEIYRLHLSPPSRAPPLLIA